jgi:hypothetical protein
MAYQSSTEAIEESGERLATFARKGSRGGPDAELRVSLDHYQGHPFISIRVWEQGRDRRWWPVKGKGVSVRVAEARGVAEALLEALDKLDVEPAREWTPPPRPAREPARGPQRPREQRLPFQDGRSAGRPPQAKVRAEEPLPWEDRGESGDDFNEF